MLYLKGLRFSCKLCLNSNKSYICTHVHRVNQGIESIPFLGKGRNRGKQFRLTKAEVDTTRNQRCTRTNQFKFNCDKFCCRGKRPSRVYLDTRNSNYEPLTQRATTISAPIENSKRGSKNISSSSESEDEENDSDPSYEPEDTVSSDENSTDEESVKTQTVTTREERLLIRNLRKGVIDNSPPVVLNQVLHDLSDVRDSNPSNSAAETSEDNTLAMTIEMLSDFSDLTDIEDETPIEDGSKLKTLKDQINSPFTKFLLGSAPNLLAIPNFPVSYERTKL